MSLIPLSPRGLDLFARRFRLCCVPMVEPKNIPGPSASPISFALSKRCMAAFFTPTEAVHPTVP